MSNFMGLEVCSQFCWNPPPISSAPAYIQTTILKFLLQLFFSYLGIREQLTILPWKTILSIYPSSNNLSSDSLNF